MKLLTTSTGISEQRLLHKISNTVFDAGRGVVEHGLLNLNKPVEAAKRGNYGGAVFGMVASVSDLVFRTLDAGIQRAAGRQPENDANPASDVANVVDQTGNLLRNLFGRKKGEAGPLMNILSGVSSAGQAIQSTITRGLRQATASDHEVQPSIAI